MKERCIPTVFVNNLDEISDLCTKLQEQGYKRIEILVRNSIAFDALKLATQKFKNIEFGVGTIINKKQCREAIKIGAKFIVSPGFSKEIAIICKRKKIEYIPGCVTPTEIMEAIRFNIKKIKYFPTKIYGGIDGIKALQGPFPDILFMPSGNIQQEDIEIFLKLPNVYAVSSSCFQKQMDS